jgi:hypothetical protein
MACTSDTNVSPCLFEFFLFIRVLLVYSSNCGTIAQERTLLMSVNGFKADREWCHMPPITKPPIDTSAS